MHISVTPGTPRTRVFVRKFETRGTRGRFDAFLSVFEMLLQERRKETLKSQV